MLVAFLIFPASAWALSPIQIHQCLPNPSDEANEYIELINPNSENVDIGNYQLDDEPNAGSKPYKIPSGTLINASSTMRFTKSQTNIALNNSKQKDQPFADVVRLLDTSGNQIDSITYSTTQTDVPISHSSPIPSQSIAQPTSALIFTPTPTSIPPTSTPTSKPYLTSLPTHTLIPESDSQVLSAVSSISPSNIIPTPSITSDSANLADSSFYFPWGWLLIGLGVPTAVTGIYLTRYTSSYEI